MVEHAIGIDLGTTNSCVAVWRNEQVVVIVNGQGNRTTPSFVAFTHTERLVGDAAKDQCRINPTNTIFGAKRLIGRKFNDPCVQRFIAQSPFKVIAGPGDKPRIVVSFKGEEKQFVAEEISSMVLANMHALAEKYLGKKVSKAVVTVPAYFSDSQRRATKDAGRIAGLNVMRVLSEPTAAAVAYGFDNMISGSEVEKNVLVFDLGGGTFDVSIIHIKGGNMEVKATLGDSFLGGEDFDDRMVSHFVKDFEKKNKMNISCNPRAMRRIRSACEKAKRNLSFTEETMIDLDCLYKDIDYQATVRRGIFEELNMDLFVRCIDTVKKCLADAKLVKGNVNEVVVVGGSTRIPKIEEMLREFFDGIKLCNLVNPEEAVAFGAAIQAAKLVDDENKRLQNLMLRDVSPLSLGVIIKGEIMSVVIPRNTSIPTKMTKYYVTAFDNQTEVLLAVYEGERKLANDNHFLGEFVLSGLPKALAGDLKVIITFELDADGILIVSAEHHDSGSKEKITIMNEEGRLTIEEIDRMVEEAQRYRIEDEEKARKAVAKFELEALMFNLKFRVSTSEIKAKEKKNMHFSIKEVGKWFDKNVDSADALEFEKEKNHLERMWNRISKQQI